MVSEEEGRVCGYIIFTVKEAAGLIVSLAVSPEFRRRGHGGALLQHALHELTKNIRLVELQVRVTDKDAVAFYEKWGFKVCSTIRRYYSDGEDALVMRRQVNGLG